MIAYIEHDTLHTGLPYLQYLSEGDIVRQVFNSDTRSGDNVCNKHHYSEYHPMCNMQEYSTYVPFDHNSIFLFC